MEIRMGLPSTGRTGSRTRTVRPNYRLPEPPPPPKQDYSQYDPADRAMLGSAQRMQQEAEKRRRDEVMRQQQYAMRSRAAGRTDYGILEDVPQSFLTDLTPEARQYMMGLPEVTYEKPGILETATSYILGAGRGVKQLLQGEDPDFGPVMTAGTFTRGKEEAPINLAHWLQASPEGEQAWLELADRFNIDVSTPEKLEFWMGLQKGQKEETLQHELLHAWDYEQARRGREAGEYSVPWSPFLSSIRDVFTGGPGGEALGAFPIERLIGVEDPMPFDLREELRQQYGPGFRTPERYTELAERYGFDPSQIPAEYQDAYRSLFQEQAFVPPPPPKQQLPQDIETMLREQMKARMSQEEFDRWMKMRDEAEEARGEIPPTPTGTPTPSRPELGPGMGPGGREKLEEVLPVQYVDYLENWTVTHGPGERLDPNVERNILLLARRGGVPWESDEELRHWLYERMADLYGTPTPAVPIPYGKG